MRRLFPSQMPEEKIYIVVREHWVLLALKLLIWLIFLLIPILFYLFAPASAPVLFEGQLGIITKIFTEVYLIFLLLSLFLIFILYYLNIHIITNLRIVDVDQDGIFSHAVSELHIDKIEDVTSHTKGVLGTLFDFGFVLIQTAGATERFDFENVPRPGQLEKLILDLYEQRAGPGQGLRQVDRAPVAQTGQPTPPSSQQVPPPAQPNP